MKKLFLIILCSLLITGCLKLPISSNIENDDNIYYKDFGSYEIPEDWIESKEQSTFTKFFYCLKGDENKARPNNISINQGTNYYSKEDHETFRKAIMAQLSMQLNGRDDVEVKANGFTTDNDYIAYAFIINDLTENIVTTQYYIIGNYEYVLIHETVFGESEETDNAAKLIVNSFIWN